MSHNTKNNSSPKPASPLSLSYMGDDVLLQKADPVTEITPEIEELAAAMLDLMYEEEGVGLAAPQIGRSIRLVVIDCDYSDKHPRNPYVLVNPRILKVSDEVATEPEGCLSFPGASVKIERPIGVIVEAENLAGDTLRYEAEHSLLARCLQHEIDHLDGITMLDHLGPIARTKAAAKVKEELKGMGE